MKDPTARFSDRVDNYIKSRPHYPSAVIEFLEATFNLTEHAVVADIGSGTGISCELFLCNGNRVFGVEPNREMRQAAERLLSRYERFDSVDGTSDATTLPSESVDVVVAAQAFHWFDRAKAKKEFQRIGNANAFAVLMWNDRVDATSFMIAYEEFVQRFATDYSQVSHRNVVDREIEEFFSPAKAICQSFSHHRYLDFEGLKGLLLSSSYMPNVTHERYGEMLEAMRAMFAAHQTNELVRMEYVARAYCAKLH